MLAVVAAALSFTYGQAAEPFIVVQSTTSTQNSGLYETILPAAELATGIGIRMVAVGTGQAIKNARNCDGDVLLVHAKSAEEKFVAEGFGLARHDLMYNDFVIVGPADDSAGISGQTNVTTALATIAESEAMFISRGDDSGTHQAEMRLWADTGHDPILHSGKWYRETGSGMGATLNIAIGLNGYALTDRATWIRFGNKGDHKILLEGDPRLFNQYGIIVVNPEACPAARFNAAQAFVDWMLSDQGQAAIATHLIGGQQLFFPNAD
ncbi:MAG: substrate-binding domain-containing protein [Pseudomonadota bacterium]